MNFDNGQGLKFGLPSYGQGFDNPAGNVCQFQYVGLENMAGTIKQGQAMQSIPPDHSASLGHHYRNMNIRHPHGSPVQNAFPIGINISMATNPQFNTMQPLDSFAMHQGYPSNQRPDMHYKIFNNWIGPAQGNVFQGHSQPRQQGQPQVQVPQSQSQGQASLPSFGHLWSHFQQQQMQKQQALQHQEPQKQQQQQQQQQYVGNQPLQMQNFPSTVALIPNVSNNSISLQRGQRINYQYSPQNVGVVTQARVCPSVSADASQASACASQTVGVENPISMVVAAASNLAACSVSAAGGLVVSSGSTPVTNMTTTVTMTTCSSSPVTTTAAVHSGIPVSSVGPVKGLLSSETEKNHSEVLTEQCNVQKDDGPQSDDSQGENGSSGKSKSNDGTFQIVKVPFGWRRTTEDGAVIYYSPSNTRLTSYHEVCKYLVSDGTCKCGIECPLQVEKVFNFDPFVNGKLWTVDDVSTEDLTKLCIHKRKIIAMATFQRSQTIPGAILGQSHPAHGKTKAGNSRTKRESKPRKKVKNKVNSTPYDGLLVSQLLAQRANSPQVINNTLQKPPVTNFSPPNNLNLGANTKLHHQSDVGDMTSPLSGDMLRDPMDDLGPITCQVPAKLDFSAGCILNNPAHRIANSALTQDASHLVIPAKNISAQQGPFSPDHLKNQQFPLQQHSPVQCVPASPSFVTNVPPNHMYGPNIPQHFQIPVNLQQQQQQQQHQPGGMMFQSMMQVQNASGHRVPNPAMFDQSGMQASPVHVGSQQQNLMFNSVYPQLSDLTWLDSGKPKTKRPRSKKDKQKLNSILDRTSPCPNVDVRNLAPDSSRNCGTKPSVSFLENPSAFLAQQTALVQSSLNSSQMNVFHKTSANNPSSISCTPVSATGVCVSTASANMKETLCSSASAKSPQEKLGVHSSVLPNVSDSVAVKSDDKVVKKELQLDGVSGKNISENNLKETSSNETSSSKSASQHDEKASDCKKSVANSAMSKSHKPKSRSSILAHLNQTSGKSCSSANSDSATATSELPSITTGGLTVGGVTQPASGDFPASSLLSAAAKAQGSQASPLGLVLGNPIQMNPGLSVNVSPDMTGVGGTGMGDVMGKSAGGLSSLDQLCLSFGSGGIAPVMIPQNNILAGALPGLQGLPVNMCLPLGQPVMNSGVVNLSQNLMFSGVDPTKIVSQIQQPDRGVSASSSSSKAEVKKESGAQSVGAVTVQHDSVNISNITGVSGQPGTEFKNLTCTSAAVNQVSSASNSQLLNNQFPFVTMNTPMPPISLPVVTNVTNSLSQVIPAVGVPQTILNQHPLGNLLSTVAVPAMNNSVMLTNPATQTCAQNISYFGMPVSAVTSVTTAAGKSEERTNADSNSDRGSVAENMSAGDKTEGSESASVDNQMQQETQNLVLFPNINMPLLQVVDGNSMMAGMDKLGTVPQVMIPGTILDSQSPLCQNNPCAGLPLNLFQLQQMWNNVGGAGVPSINALQLQQLQALQLQLLLQQLHVQGMQNLVNQINLQGATVEQENGAESSPVGEDEVDSEEQVAQDSAEEGDQDDDESSLEDSTPDENGEQEEHQVKDVSPRRVESVSKKESVKSKSSASVQTSTHKSSKNSEVRSARVKSLSNSKPYMCTHSDSSGTKLKFVSVSSETMNKNRADSKSKGSDGVKSHSSSKKQNKKQKYSSEKKSLCYDRVKYECSRSFNCQDVPENFAKSSPDRQSDSSTSVFEEESDKNKLSRESLKDQIMGKKDLMKSESCEDLSSGISGKRTSDSSDASVNDQTLSDSGFTDCSDPSANESHETLPHHSGESTDKSDTGEATEEDDLPLVDLKRKAKKRLYPEERDVEMDGLENLDDYSMDHIECNSMQDVPRTGDLVWGQIRGFPLWPGKLVPEEAAANVDLGPDYGEGIATVIVMWYGDHTFTRVEPERLKSWREGLIAHHKTRRRRKGRKMNSNLEAAIQEAMKDVSVDCMPVFRTWRGRSNKKKKT